MRTSSRRRGHDWPAAPRVWPRPSPAPRGRWASAVRGAPLRSERGPTIIFVRSEAAGGGGRRGRLESAPASSVEHRASSIEHRQPTALLCCSAALLLPRAAWRRAARRTSGPKGVVSSPRAIQSSRMAGARARPVAAHPAITYGRTAP